MAQWQRIHCQRRRRRFDPWVRKMSWRRKCPPTPGFFPGESHRQRRLAGYGVTRSRTRLKWLRIRLQGSSNTSVITQLLPPRCSHSVVHVDVTFLIMLLPVARHLCLLWTARCLPTPLLRLLHLTLSPRVLSYITTGHSLVLLPYWVVTSWKAEAASDLLLVFPQPLIPHLPS